ncbi:MAG: hypothetical protein DWQ01_12515 [Planctomycetota bacterium]|nr:MAG: hypothetical protein DWQ01_12515 [Planctomycetota bacterium]
MQLLFANPKSPQAQRTPWFRFTLWSLWSLTWLGACLPGENPEEKETQAQSPLSGAEIPQTPEKPKAQTRTSPQVSVSWSSSWNGGEWVTRLVVGPENRLWAICQQPAQCLESSDHGRSWQLRFATEESAGLVGGGWLREPEISSQASQQGTTSILLVGMEGQVWKLSMQKDRNDQSEIIRTGGDILVRETSFSRSGKHILLVGETGRLVESRDGGGHWQSHDLPSQSSLHAAWIDDSGRAWVGGSGGLLFERQKIESGKIRWQQKPLPEPFQIEDILFHGQHLGWCAGSQGKLFQTEDGGNTWHRQPQVHPGFFTRLARSQDGHLFIAGDAGLVQYRRAGEKNWKALPTFDQTLWLDLLFLPSRELLLAGSDPFIASLKWP